MSKPAFDLDFDFDSDPKNWTKSSLSRDRED